MRGGKPHALDRGSADLKPPPHREGEEEGQHDGEQRLHRGQRAQELQKAEQLATTRDPADDEKLHAAIGTVDPVTWSMDAVRRQNVEAGQAPP